MFFFNSLYYLRDGPALSGAKSPSLSLAAHLRAKMLIINILIVYALLVVEIRNIIYLL